MTPASPGIIIAALLLDLVIGDPRWLPHPVVQIGRVISFLEPRLRAVFRDTRAAGVALFVLTVAVSAGAAWLVLDLARAVAPLCHTISAVAVSCTCLAARSLHRESALVARALHEGDIGTARQRLAMIVGRDTDRLDEAGIWRALIETVSENTSDGIIAPLFWLTVGGPVAGIAYKAVSTLDSMVGYRNERYLLFGRASARMDDLLNFVPARLTVLLMVLSAPLAGLSARGAARIALRDRRNHPSPNSGHPEAAAAGALGVRLGGPASYGGVTSLKMHIGDPLHPLDERAYRRMIRLMYLTTLLMAAACAAAAIFWGGLHVPFS